VYSDSEDDDDDDDDDDDAVSNTVSSAPSSAFSLPVRANAAAASSSLSYRAVANVVVDAMLFIAERITEVSLVSVRSST
jgi:hypothetical protein